MTHKFAETMFTDSVKTAQLDYGSRPHNERLTERAGPNDVFTEREIRFIEQRDSFYMATVNEDGWPYVQHRGGPAGFLRVFNNRQLAFADFRGNLQLITAGNSVRNDKVSLILVDYPKRKRLKVIGRVTFHGIGEVEPELLNAVELPDYRARIERVVIVDLTGFDWNCPQHITPRYTEPEWLAMSVTDNGDQR